MKKTQAEQLELFTTDSQLVDEKQPEKKTTRKVGRPRKAKVENSLPLFGDDFFDGLFEKKSPSAASPEPADNESRLLKLKEQSAELQKQVSAARRNPAEKEKLAAEWKRVNREIYELENPELVAAEKQETLERAEEERKEKEYLADQPKRQYQKGSWEEAREKNKKRIALVDKTTEELEDDLAKRKSKLPKDALPQADEDYFLINEELKRRDQVDALASRGFTPVGEDVAVMPRFLINVMSVARHARKYKGIGMRSPEKNERYFVNEQLHYREYEQRNQDPLFPQKAFESIIYTGFELSIEEVLVFLALIKNTTDKEQKGADPWGILKCKKRFIIDFLGWNQNATKKRGKFYTKVMSCLDVLTQGSWKIEWGSGIYHGHLIADYYLSKRDIKYKTGSVPENLEDLGEGEFYYRISPPLIALFSSHFFKANISVVRKFLRSEGRATDLKAWFYLYLMSLYYKEERKEVTNPQTGLKETLIIPTFQNVIKLEEIKNKSGYVGELKELKRVMIPILMDMAKFFAANSGILVAKWDDKNKYQLNISEFRRPRIYDVDPDGHPAALIQKN